jgi:Cleft lip and palate transmembrane protein 1 (CLPTM1)
MRPLLDVDQAAMTYAPTLWLNDFWLLRDKLLPMNATVTSANITFSLYSLPAWKLMLYTQMEQSFAMQQSWGAMQDGESDDLKRVLTEGNPYFLALTMVVSLLHSVFDALAFKNDIGFWKGKKDVAGLSVRTIGFNAACQAIIFLYLLDNDTSFVVLMSTGVGLAIELWKLTQAMDVSLVVVNGRPRVKFADKASYTASQTDRHDAVAMKWLSIALIPCVGGYAIYTLLNETHKSWYSWILSSLVGAVYAFGFVLMCPQLYLNYKLKSVAHLPWRQMTYKFLNTIIDDLFAFVIKMPTLHRLSVFRDDIVFAIYLYQRWIYRVDKTRANEFGYQEEEGEDDKKKKEEGDEAALVETDADAGPSTAAGPSADGLRRRDKGKAAVVVAAE